MAWTIIKMIFSVYLSYQFASATLLHHEIPYYIKTKEKTKR